MFLSWIKTNSAILISPDNHRVLPDLQEFDGPTSRDREKEKGIPSQMPYKEIPETNVFKPIGTI